MNKPISIITGYHAHIYYTTETKEVAQRLREQIGQKFAVKLGRWHDNFVGPHKASMYLVAFKAPEFNKIVPWLMINRTGLDILVHPETGNDLEDHTENALWLGTKLDLKLDAL
ncbi:DOPA 4,5-dioxygenase family protein [Sneathiella glossodoripedis]|uniref:DOPA 4,5-dioxygenase family protein n=1 Tax=Sneathiella glossodoripedis TaxID=418853 RepID=UPI0005692D9E|nr:DOPA 4,5-dioxygenase family protein [Sneathiella glossodoripedis]